MSQDSREMRFEPLTGVIGAAASGLDLAEPLSEEDIAQLRRAIDTFGVVFFANQNLDTERQSSIAQQFGPLFEHPLAAEDKNSTVTVLDSGISNMFDEGEKPLEKNTGWHTDASFESTPPYMAILRPVVLPPVGGDTIWSSTCAVYETLSTAIRNTLDGLTAVHDPNKLLSRKGLPNTGVAPIVHPVVFADQFSGRKAIYVNENYTTEIQGISSRQSTRLLDLLFELIASPEYQVRFRWAPGTVAMWNERTTQHFGVGDYEGRRIMHRVVVSGEAGG